jgi:uncharacterized protein YraI
MHVLRRRFVLLVILTVLAIVPSSLVGAQGQSLNYGSALIYSISAASPFGFFSFQGEANDVVTIQVLGITPGFKPTVSLNDPTQQQLAVSSPDPSSPGSARITAQLEDSGFYTIIVSSTDELGEFALRLDGAPGTVVDALSDEPLALTSSPLIIPIEASPDTAQQLTVSATPEEVAFTAVLRNEDGQTIVSANGSGESPTQMTIPAGDASYSLEIYAVDPNLAGSVNVSLQPLGAAPETTPADDTGAEEAATPTTAPENACQVSGVNVNVRSGPGTDYNVIATMNGGVSYAVLGINNGWYAIDLSGGSVGWVFSDVVQTTGDCSNLSTYEFTGESAPPPQTTEEADSGQPQQATATYTPSYTPTTSSNQPQQATPTYTPSPTSPPQQQEPTTQPTATYTPTYTPTTPPAAQVAPPDSNYALVIPLDETVSLLDFVSYPDGDTQDRISYRVTGMNPNVAFSGGRARLVISVSCFGENTDQIEFFATGNTYSCGQTLVDREVTFDSNTGSVTVTAVGGEGTYVQWVLTGTVTRLN